ncbi:hypothetical protein J1N35_018747 [Gossypium stocksii]|uniref:Uncharacterized protein n=1 Tax=Gossypium stocksii TaxID=47602 RepID=A0A9D3VRL8_9ROSI|nr:hypothetical protein J1N35_018747 [Gossypium stocksii]
MGRDGVGDTKPVETNPINEENMPKASEEKPEKIESVSIETNCEDEEEANLSISPLMDSTVAIPPPSIEPMIEHDYEINRIINEHTRFDNEEGDVPLNLLKRLMYYKVSAQKTTLRN